MPGVVDDCLTWNLRAHNVVDPRGHPQGVPLRGIGLGGAFGVRAWAPTRGAPTDGLGWVARLGCRLGHPRGVPLRKDWIGWRSLGAGLGTHKGCPYGGLDRVVRLGLRAWAPTRGAPTGGWPGGRKIQRALVPSQYAQLRLQFTNPCDIRVLPSTAQIVGDEVCHNCNNHHRNDFVKQISPLRLICRKG